MKPRQTHRWEKSAVCLFEKRPVMELLLALVPLLKYFQSPSVCQNYALRANFLKTLPIFGRNSTRNTNLHFYILYSLEPGLNSNRVVHIFFISRRQVTSFLT